MKKPDENVSRGSCQDNFSLDYALSHNVHLEVIPDIPAVTESDRPFWSIMIPTFNCAKYLSRTLESVLAQDAGPQRMQIEVVDHCSTEDDPEEIVKRVGRGRVGFYRKPINEGPVANFNECIRRSRGHLVHILHGDDYVLPGFREEIERLFELRPEAALFATRCFFVDEEDIATDMSPRLQQLEKGSKTAEPFYYDTAAQFPGVVLARRFYERHGGFMSKPSHVTDREMWVRAISLEGGIVSAKVLACYRVSAENDTARLKRTGENLMEIMSLNRIFERRYQNFAMPLARKRVVCLARSQAEKFATMHDYEAARVNWRIWAQVAPWRERVKYRLTRLVSGLQKKT